MNLLVRDGATVRVATTKEVLERAWDLLDHLAYETGITEVGRPADSLKALLDDWVGLRLEEKGG